MEFRQLQFILEKTYPKMISVGEYSIILDFLDFINTHNHGEFNIQVNTSMDHRTKRATRVAFVNKVDKDKIELDVLSD